MKRVIVYGLGKRYRESIDRLSREYEIVGVTSGNSEEKKNFRNYVDLTEVNETDYDAVLVCSNFEREIINRLVDELEIAKNRILVDYAYYNRGGVFHGQVNEDAIVLLLLQSMGVETSDATYLELGTNKPIALNNTYCMYRLGARGVLVEPNLELKNYIEVVRPRDRLITKAISLDGKETMFYKFSGSSVSTLAIERLDKDVIDKIVSFKLEESYMVDTITINELFAQLDVMPDFMSIDIEGLDYQVLLQMNYDLYRPKIIMAEMTALGSIEQDGEKIKELLKNKQYIMVHENGINAIFVDCKYKEKIKRYL